MAAFPSIDCQFACVIAGREWIGTHGGDEKEEWQQRHHWTDAGLVISAAT